MGKLVKTIGVGLNVDLLEGLAVGVAEVGKALGDTLGTTVIGSALGVIVEALTNATSTPST